jgi:hypothetical protein
VPILLPPGEGIVPRHISGANYESTQHPHSKTKSEPRMMNAPSIEWPHFGHWSNFVVIVFSQ